MNSLINLIDTLTMKREKNIENSIHDNFFSYQDKLL